MIGLSLSFCVQDILKGYVELDSVDKIITGTRIDSPDAMEEVVSIYMTNYWKNDPRAVEIVSYLFRTGRIEQPKCEGKDPPNICEGHWIDDSGKQFHLKGEF